MSIKGDISISGNRPPLKPVRFKGKPEEYLRLFQILIDTAVKGDRCPVLDEFKYLYKISSTYRVTALSDLGWVRMEVYTKNYRVVEIMVGPHKGSRTKECPGDHDPYKVWYNPGGVTGEQSR